MINSFDMQYFQQQPELCVWSNEKFTCSVAQDVSIDRDFYITESARGQDERNAQFWLATPAGNMGPFCSLAISRVGRARKSGHFDFQGRSQLFNLNHGQTSSGQYCIIHIFLSFLGSLTKQCTLFEIFLQFSLPPPYTKVKLGKKCRIHSSNIVCGVRGGVGPVWIGKRPRNAKCPKTFVQDNEDCSCRPGWLSVPHILKIARMTSTHWRHQTLWALKSFLAQANNTYFITSGRVIKPKICMSGPTGLWAGYTPDFYFASVHKNAEKNLANIQQFWSHTCQVWPDQ